MPSIGSSRFWPSISRNLWRQYLTPAGQCLPSKLDESILRPFRVEPIDPVEGSHEDCCPAQIDPGGSAVGVVGALQEEYLRLPTWRGHDDLFEASPIRCAEGEFVDPRIELNVTDPNRTCAGVSPGLSAEIDECCTAGAEQRQSLSRMRSSLCHRLFWGDRVPHNDADLAATPTPYVRLPALGDNHLPLLLVAQRGIGEWSR